jgi:hypothetical protein
MNQGFGHELPGRHAQTSHREASRYLVVIQSGGVGIARLFLDSKEQVAEFDGSAEEVASMTKGLQAARVASDPSWDRALAGHSAEERERADVYALSI